MDRQNAAAALMEFNWQRQPEAEKLVRELVGEFLSKNPIANELALRMKEQTGTRFLDWIDYIIVSPGGATEARLRRAGYVQKYVEDGEQVWRQPQGVFPTILVDVVDQLRIALKVESVADFAAANSIDDEIEGEPGSACRWLPLPSMDMNLSVIERHGYTRYDAFADTIGPELSVTRLRVLERFRSRRRNFGDEEEGFEYSSKLIDAAISSVGVDAACDAFFAAEREYWQRRNRAAQFQKARQDRLGLGWANHDHHTYRCSRKYFSRLIGLWEKLGFQLRERFYAGAEAGWGAQICEQPNAGIITFNDVDLSPDELMNDFAHVPLPERNHLGTVGLWCALHGESFLQAGMHHLECQFDFDSLKQQMEKEGNIKVMKPFTDFPYLRQAFTEGERWPVQEDRLATLLAKNQISEDQAAQFRANGAIGSHLENLERNEGFKGFNQKGVSEIIAKTDPRNNL